MGRLARCHLPPMSTARRTTARAGKISRAGKMVRRRSFMNEKNQVPPAPPPSFCFLHKIYSIKKQLEIFDILQAIHSTHSERLFLAGFLKYAGYSYDETFKIIDEHCQWEDYDPKVTSYQLSTIFNQLHRTSSNTSTNRRVRKWDLLPTEEYRIKLARSTESHRINEEWMKENNIPIYDAAPELDFNPALLGDDGLSKDVARRWR